MAEIMRMPGVLAGATEAILSKWLVAEGASFKTGEPIAEVETEKALVEVPAERDGVLGKYLLAAGKPTDVGQPIAVLLAVGESNEAVQKAVAELGSAPETVETIKTETVVVASSPADSPSPIRQFVSPIARKLARELGVDLSSISGSGPEGRITKADVHARSSRQSAPSHSMNSTTALVNAVVPHSPMRKAIARRLTESKSTVPHFYLEASLIADDFLNLRSKLNEWAPAKLSVTDLLLKTISAAFGDVPGATVIWTPDALHYLADVDISVAVATDNGLITPVVRKVNQLSTQAIPNVTGDLFARARDGKLKQHEIEGGSISLTNLGMYGTDTFSAILNPPQSMILAVGAAKKRPVVVDDALVVKTVINFTLSVDHRAVDGALAAQWLNAFTKRFENPLWMVI